ncbi:hypothetical protein AMECASPLE_039581 [Ameca splendens]|uniref:Uncharacterized protein n=1 Tax=Ameca splendens TaxID=208324 RepID=A0ABV0Z748_9TELE
MLCCRSAWPAHHHRIPRSPGCFLNSPGLLDRRNLEVLKRCSHKMVLDFTFLFKNNQIFLIVFHIFTSRSTLPDNELKGEDKKLTDSILEKSRAAVYSRSTGLLHYLKSYTERLKQGSFQSNRGAN